MAHPLAPETTALRFARIRLAQAALVLERLTRGGPTSGRRPYARDDAFNHRKPAPRLDFSPHGRTGTH